MRLIDANELKESIKKELGIKDFVYLLPAEKAIIDQIDKAPVVCVPQNTLLRCRTCSFFVSEDRVTGGCSMFGGERTADDYCSKGAWISNATD